MESLTCAAYLSAVNSLSSDRMSRQTPFQTYLLKRKPYAESTLTAYQADVDRFLARLPSSHTSVDDATTATLEEHLSSMRAAARNRALRSLTLYFAYRAESSLKPSTNPAADLHRRAVEPRQRPQLRYRDLKKLEVAAIQHMLPGSRTSLEVGQRQAAMLALFAHLGLSTSQAISLTADDVLSERGRILVRVSNVKGDAHELEVPSAVAQLLVWLPETARQVQYARGRVDGPFPLLVGLRGRHRGHPLTAHGIHAALHKLATDAKVQRPVTPTNLRRLAKDPKQATATTQAAIEKAQRDRPPERQPAPQTPTRTGR